MSVCAHVCEVLHFIAVVFSKRSESYQEEIHAQYACILVHALFCACALSVQPPHPTPPRLMHTHIQHVLVLIVCAVCPHYRPFCSTGLMFVLGPQNGRAQPKMGKRIRDDTGGCVMVVKGGLGVLPWCLAPNGIRGEQPRKGNKVKLRCCQLRLTTSGPDSGGTGALSRHRSHSPFTPFSLSTHPFISNSFFSHFIVLLHPPPPPPERSSCLLSALRDAATKGWSFFKVYSFESNWKQKDLQSNLDPGTVVIFPRHASFVIVILSSFCETWRSLKFCCPNCPVVFC